MEARRPSRPTEGGQPIRPGPTIRLAPAAPTMGIAEGIETALSATKLFGVPVWSVMSDYGMATFEPPPEVQHLIIFADHDEHGAGQRAACQPCCAAADPDGNQAALSNLATGMTCWCVGEEIQLAG